jgi:hypothetical protein
MSLKVNELLDKTELEEYIQHTIFKRIRIILEISNKLQTNFMNHLFNNDNIQINTNSDLANSYSIEKNHIVEHPILEVNNLLDNLYIGSLIPISCGHNGNYSETELQFIKYELIKAKFI